MRPVILCVGSYSIKVGWSGDEAPTAVVRTHSTTDIPDLFRYLVNTKQEVVNREAMKDCLIECLKLVGYEANEMPPVLLVTSSASPDHVLNKALTDILFTDLKAPSLCLTRSTEVSYLSLPSSTGIMLDIGDLQATATAVYEGHVLSSKTTTLSGRLITNYLYELLKSKLGLTEASDYLTERLHVVKENLCHIATPNFEAACQLQTPHNDLEQTVEVLSHTPTITTERFIAPELLFSPSLTGLDCQGVQHLIYDIVLDSPITTRSALTKNIQLIGGSSAFPGLVERLKFELEWLDDDLFQPDYVTISRPEPDIEWLGCSVLSSLSNFSSLLKKKDCYLK